MNNLDAIIYYSIGLVHWMIILRIFLSWAPMNLNMKFQKLLYDLTEPLLSLFRRVIPPTKSGLDFSPVLALLALNILQNILLS